MQRGKNWKQKIFLVLQGIQWLIVRYFLSWKDFLIIAQRFIAGYSRRAIMSPGGMTEKGQSRSLPYLRFVSVVPPGLSEGSVLLPSDKSLGYYQPSLRDSGTLAQYELPIKFSEEPHFLICAFAPLRETPFSVTVQSKEVNFTTETQRTLRIKEQRLKFEQGSCLKHQYAIFTHFLLFLCALCVSVVFSCPSYFRWLKCYVSAYY